MTVEEILPRLQSLADPKTRSKHVKDGAGEGVYGVKMGDLRVIAKEIKTNQELGAKLWETGNLDAMLLSILIINPKQLTAEEVEAMVDRATYPWLADWVNSYVVKAHPEKEALRMKWMSAPETMRSRAGWSLTAERIVKSPEGLDLAALLDRIENEMPSAKREAQWTMNFCLAEIGINFPEHRDRAMEIGERLGIFRDYPTPKGCTSPFAPLWISAMVARQK